MNTKERIFDEALDLFSKKGYDSVSLREIADNVGIRKSSIYSHYSSKDAILMDILDYLKGLFENDELLTSREFSLSLDNEILSENPERFYHQGSEAIKEMFLSERNLKIWKLVFIQMHYNENIRQFFRQEILAGPLAYWEEFFKILQENGTVSGKYDPKVLARQYYSFPIYLLVEIIAAYDDIPGECLDDFFSQAEEHAKFLLESIRVK